MKNKLISKFKSNKTYLVSLLVGLIIIGLLYKLNNVTPFGGKSLLCVDFYHQYGPMLGELYDRVKSGSNLIYSFNMAMGLPFFRNFLNYLSSPFNIIMFIFPRKYLVTSYSFIIGLKAVASCFTCTYYLTKKFKTKELYLVPLGILYAFQAYYSAYYWDLMWIDGMVFLPIITLGIENIVNNKKWKLYTITLAIMLLANYFIGYMICIFSVIYFILYNIYKFKFKKGHIKEAILRFLENSFMFAFSSLLSGCLTAFLLLPMAASLSSISATGGEMPTTQYYAFELIDFLKGHLTGVNTTVFASDSITNPNISVGILSVGLLLLYLINLTIPIKNKICYLLALGFFIACFFVPQMDYVMQAFHVPNDLPYRYSFLYSFVLIIISAYSLVNIKSFKYPLVLVSYIFLMIVLLLITQDKWEDITNNMIYINMIILSLYFVFYSGWYFINDMKNVFYVAIIAVAAIDVIVSINHNWNITQTLSVFYEDYNPTTQLLNYVKKNDNEKFYRIENTNMMTLNDGSWYNYYGMTSFTSMAYESFAKLHNRLGMPGNEINSYYYVQSTPVYDLMFDMKYFIGNTNDYNRYIETKRIDETANEFTYNVGLAYGVNKDLKTWKYPQTNPFDYQNEYMRLATGSKNIFNPATLVNTTEIYNNDGTTILKYQFENPGDNLYLYAKDYTVDYMVIGDTLYYNNEDYSSKTNLSSEISYSYLESYEENKVININSTEDVITLIVCYNAYYTKGFEMYTIDHNEFANAYNILNKNKYNIIDFKEHTIEGNISLDDNMDIYTSIPYDEGWHAYIDGKEVKTYALEDALLMIEGTKGNHKLKLKYKIPYFKEGLIASIVALIIIILDTLYDNDKIKQYLNKKSEG